MSPKSCQCCSAKTRSVKWDPTITFNKKKKNFTSIFHNKKYSCNRMFCKWKKNIPRNFPNLSKLHWLAHIWRKRKKNKKAIGYTSEYLHWLNFQNMNLQFLFIRERLFLSLFLYDGIEQKRLRKQKKVICKENIIFYFPKWPASRVFSSTPGSV